MSTIPVRVLRPSRLKLLGMTTLCVPFVAGSAWMIARGDQWAWFGLAFFGLCALVFLGGLLATLVPNGVGLHLNAKGFSIRTLFLSHRYRWADVDCFGVTAIGGNAMVVFNFSSDYDRAAFGRKASVSLFGWEAALPDTYGLSAEALADLMNEYKKASWLSGRTGAAENTTAPTNPEGIRTEN